MNASLDYRPLSTAAWDDVVDAFNAAYAGYIVPLSMTADDLRFRCRIEDVAPEHSVLVACGEQVVGIALVAIRGRRARLAAFGFATAWRGRGLGGQVLAHLVAHVPGIERWELEVIEQNLPAVRLYTSAGFRAAEALHGHERAPRAGDAEPALSRMTVREVADRMPLHEDLPWQLDRSTVARLRDPWFGVHDRHGAYAVVDDTPQDALQLRWLFEREPGIGAAALIRALAAHHAHGRPIRMAPLAPASCDARLRDLGFVRQSLNQLRMIRD